MKLWESSNSVRILSDFVRRSLDLPPNHLLGSTDGSTHLPKLPNDNVLGSTFTFQKGDERSLAGRLLGLKDVAYCPFKSPHVIGSTTRVVYSENGKWRYLHSLTTNTPSFITKGGPAVNAAQNNEAHQPSTSTPEEDSDPYPPSSNILVQFLLKRTNISPSKHHTPTYFSFATPLQLPLALLSVRNYTPTAEHPTHLAFISNLHHVHSASETFETDRGEISKQSIHVIQLVVSKLFPEVVLSNDVDSRTSAFSASLLFSVY